MLTKLSDGSYVDLSSFSAFKVKNENYSNKKYKIYGYVFNKFGSDIEYPIGNAAYSTEQEAQKELDLLMGNNKDVLPNVTVTREEVIWFLSGLSEVELKDIFTTALTPLIVGENWLVKGHTTKEIIEIMNKAISEVKCNG